MGEEEMLMLSSQPTPRFDAEPSNNTCPFCSPEVAAQAIARNGSVFAIRDKHPVAPGHTLVIPWRHTPDYFTMTPQERRDAEELLLRLRDDSVRSDPSIQAFNIGVNCGVVAGQTVLHAHIHLIPRREGDTPNPRGGVRGVIPGKMSY